MEPAPVRFFDLMEFFLVGQVRRKPNPVYQDDVPVPRPNVPFAHHGDIWR